MDETQAREQICETGRELLSAGLVARTWGNVSCRISESEFLISPSGLDYTRTQAEDIVRYNMSTGEAEGIHKPSSEKGIHAAAYELFPEVGFVVHTHQSCASALGLAGFETMDISDDERRRLGGIARAKYGLPGTKKLRNAVKAAMAGGARTVLMVKHGALVCGRDKADAMAMIRLLEDICRRNLRLDGEAPMRLEPGEPDTILKTLTTMYPNSALVDTEAALMWAGREKTLRAQLDDMAQMLGGSVRCVPPETWSVLAALDSCDAVFVPGLGAVVKAEDAEDAQALKVLVDKAALAAVHSANLGVKSRIGCLDTALMRAVYKKKYSKQRG